MVWNVQFSDDASKAFDRLDRVTQKRIVTFLRTRLVPSENPRTLAKPLQGKLAEYWRFRVGNYRIICKIDDSELLVLVVTIGHRSAVYR